MPCFTKNVRFPPDPNAHAETVWHASLWPYGGPGGGMPAGEISDRLAKRTDRTAALAVLGVMDGAPLAIFDPAQRRLTLRGASCLDDAVAFYGPLIGALRRFLDGCCHESFDVDIALSDIDSGSTRMLFALFDTLNEAAIAGNTIAVHWPRRGADRPSLSARRMLIDRFPLLCFAD